jgi:hypothetical protein
VASGQAAAKPTVLLMKSRRRIACPKALRTAATVSFNERDYSRKL